MQDSSRRRARLVLIMGIALALVAGVGTFVYASGAKTDQPVAVPVTQVLVAAREIPAKTTLTAADLKLQDFNVEAKPLAAACWCKGSAVDKTLPGSMTLDATIRLRLGRCSLMVVEK